ncbi:hypothetical protein M1145_00460 [Patescibacteria group bacterium]|nr:hypothetical protein [Patescibacteria group bacterium]
MATKENENKIEKLEAQLNLLKAELEYDTVLKKEKKKNKKNANILYQWKAPSRVYQKWDKQKIYTVFLWLLVIIVLLLFIKQYFTIIVVIALGFVIYAMTNYPPHEVEHTITDQNVIWFEKTYSYKDLSNFWFSKRGEYTILNIDTKYRIPARLVYIIEDEDIKKIRNILKEYLPYKEFKKKQPKLSQIIDGIYISV